jgi:hypothetical protein
MYCPQCGSPNDDNNYRCVKCGRVLHSATPPPAVQADDNTMGGLIPYKNSPALIAYYLGVFSIIPCFFLGIAAFILGLRGLRQAKLHPEVKGKAHAWTGILVGGFFGLLYLVMTVAGVVAAIGNR